LIELAATVHRIKSLILLTQINDDLSRKYKKHKSGLHPTKGGQAHDKPNTHSERSGPDINLGSGRYHRAGRCSCEHVYRQLTKRRDTDSRASKYAYRRVEKPAFLLPANNASGNSGTKARLPAEGKDASRPKPHATNNVRTTLSEAYCRTFTVVSCGRLQVPVRARGCITLLLRFQAF
jgi:hypothetical protein